MLILTACCVLEVANLAVGEGVVGGTLTLIPTKRTRKQKGHVVPLCRLAQQELALAWLATTGEIGDAWKVLGRNATSAFPGNGRIIRRINAATGA